MGKATVTFVLMLRLAASRSLSSCFFPAASKRLAPKAARECAEVTRVALAQATVTTTPATDAPPRGYPLPRAASPRPTRHRNRLSQSSRQGRVGVARKLERFP